MLLVTLYVPSDEWQGSADAEASNIKGDGMIKPQSLANVAKVFKAVRYIAGMGISETSIMISLDGLPKYYCDVSRKRRY